MSGPEGVNITRQIFWNVHSGPDFNIAQAALYGFALLAVSVFIFGLYRSGFIFRMKLWKRGRGTDVPRTDRIPARLGFSLLDIFGHRKILREPYQGFFHLAIFYGFLALLITTTIVALQADVFWPLFQIYFFKDGFYLSLSLFADILGGLALLGVGMALFRRYVIKPEWLDQRREDQVILWFIFFILISGFLAEALRLQATELQPGSPMAPYVWFSPVGRIFAFLFAPLSAEAARIAHRAVWWIHMLSAMGFIAGIAFTKLAHIILAPVNIFLHPMPGQPHLKLIPPEMFESAETFGVHTFEEYSPKDLFDTEVCLRCGRCVAVCPAFRTGKPLKPRDVIQNLRTHLDAISRVPVNAAGGTDTTEAEAAQRPKLIGEVIDTEVIWSCTTCMACVEACPCYISQFPKLIDLRRYLVMMESDFPAESQEVFRGMENNSNPWNIGAHTRADWAQGLNVPVLSKKGSAEYLFYVGDSGSFDDMSKKTAQALVRLFTAAGLDFAILGVEEGCDGDSAKKMGNEYLYQTLAQANIRVMNGYGVKKIICMDPHAYNLIKHDYRDLGGHYEVFHYFEILDRLLQAGRLPLKKKLDLGIVTLHDSCYLGRYNGIYSQPRNILKALHSGRLVEMADHHSKSFCCGAGGGRIWMEEHLGSRMNQARTKQAVESGADVVVTGCPFCLTMLSDGVKELHVSESLHAADLAQLVAEACDLG